MRRGEGATSEAERRGDGDDRGGGGLAAIIKRSALDVVSMHSWRVPMTVTYFGQRTSL
jgi:hypothetical protein